MLLSVEPTPVLLFAGCRPAGAAAEFAVGGCADPQAEQLGRASARGGGERHGWLGLCWVGLIGRQVG